MEDQEVAAIEMGKERVRTFPAYLVVERTLLRRDVRLAAAVNEVVYALGELEETGRLRTDHRPTSTNAELVQRRNQLRIYDVFVRALRPDVVVLVAVKNDFSDNSSIPKSVRFGFHARHPPQFFYEVAGGGFRPIEIDSAWRDYLLPEPEEKRPFVRAFFSKLSRRS